MNYDWVKIISLTPEGLEKSTYDDYMTSLKDKKIEKFTYSKNFSDKKKNGLIFFANGDKRVRRVFFIGQCLAQTFIKREDGLVDIEINNLVKLPESESLTYMDIGYNGQIKQYDKDNEKDKEIFQKLVGIYERCKKMGNREDDKVEITKKIEVDKQIVLTGAPGTGKTYSVRKYVEQVTEKDETRYKFVQFHSSYDYTDFVEGLRPVPDGNNGNMFVRMDGTFKAFCREIVNANLSRLKERFSDIDSIEKYFQYMKDADDEKKQEVYELLDEEPYYFIIDEINRADLSRVFGELMFGLEESYREVHNRFDTQYKNLVTYCMNGKGEAVPVNEDCFKDGFFVPYNLRIIGTMNDIDRSVESFDFALRRRFVWIDVKANEVMLETLKSMRDKEKNDKLSDDKLKSVAEKIRNMNKKICDAEIGLTEAYHIGPAYFKDLVRVSDDSVEEKLTEIFKNRIEPILYEYTRGRRVNTDTKLIAPCKNALGI